MTTKKQMILIVEDSTLQAKMITDLLDEHQIESEVATSGAQALEKPQSNGLASCCWIWSCPIPAALICCRNKKSKEATKNLPIIILSGLTDKENTVEALSRGVNDYITKPYHPQELLTRISNQLTVQKALAGLHEVNAAKSKIFSILAHEIKSPCNTLIGLTDILIHKEMSQVDMQGHLEAVNQSAKNVNSLLKNMLSWMERQSGSIKPFIESISISELLQEALGLYAPMAQSKNIVIQHKSGGKADIFAMADRNMLETIVRNLVANAIKFTQVEGNIELEALATETEVQIVVKDNGMGISDAEMKALFTSDVVLKQGTRAESGSGLGLMLCKEFAEAMGGRIEVVSNLGYGAEFKVVIPF